MHSDDYDETLDCRCRGGCSALLFVVAVGWAFLVATPLLPPWLRRGGRGDRRRRPWAVRVGADRHRTGRADRRPRGAAVGIVGRAEALDASKPGACSGSTPTQPRTSWSAATAAARSGSWLDDPVDPTPYWLVSTRRADELAGHLRLVLCKTDRHERTSSPAPIRAGIA